MFQKFVHARFWIDIQKVLYAAGQNQIQYHSWVPSHHQQNTYHIPEQNFPNINLMPSVLPQLILSTIIKIYPAWFILHWTAQMVEQFPIHSEAEEHLLFEINIIGKLLSILITFDSDDIRQKNNGLVFQKSFITIPPNIPCKENSELLKYYFAFLWKRAFYDVIINRFNEYFEDSHTLINQFPYLSDVNNMLMNGYYVYDVGRTFILYLHNEVFGQDLQFSWSYDSFPEYPQQNDFLIHRNDDIYNKISYFPEDDFKYSDRY
ncbi:hypothetical protein TRFO_42969 [Tritrichomonas foetus]|uniref:Uncharacterized protein n=1 Tax=Tritrichomonas foetus TaxID=1144522 RepID=A0A1J4KTH6_9EUKA|nr:hypothetical protein TRFO_42969 [Tritrichomonas foetus]|eukprot:OHT14563.1 hypothetical protein TRFO_42969 [Tritrichomonas foetus]